MIHYDVRCSAGHEFDGWFKDSAAFDKQSKRGLVECPVCGDRRVERGLMAPALAKRQNSRAEAVEPSAVPAAPPGDSAAPAMHASGPLPANLIAKLREIRTQIEQNCDYVGPKFADEARKIHRGESDKRNIYGEATPDQAEALADEGIEFANIPWVPPADG
jgi:hypothetical protein